MFQSLQKYELDQHEYGFIMDNSDRNSTTCKVMIPKLTPLMSTKEVQYFKKSFNPNIFVNSTESKPNISSSILISNFITVKKFNDTASRDFKKGERVICCVMNKDIRDIYLTNFI